MSTPRSADPAEWAEYNARPVEIYDVTTEQTVALCPDCGDEMAYHLERCVNCTEEWELARALLLRERTITT